MDGNGATESDSRLELWNTPIPGPLATGGETEATGEGKVMYQGQMLGGAWQQKPYIWGYIGGGGGCFPVL